MSPDGRTLATKQIIQSWIAECAAEIQAARLMTLNAAWKIDTLGTKAARFDISFIKFYVAGVLQKVVDRALQVHGGMGMTDDTIIAYYYRHERAARIYDGTDEVHKMSVAKKILKDYEGRTVR
jgi:alkylation response protein AidB-like acyl-CoA dehydrogenase